MSEGLFLLSPLTNGEKKKFGAVIQACFNVTECALDSAVNFGSRMPNFKVAKEDPSFVNRRSFHIFLKHCRKATLTGFLVVDLEQDLQQLFV